MLPDGMVWHLVSGPTSAREPFVARQVNRLDPDVVFSPMQTMGSLGRRYPLVLTLHDLIYYAHPTPPRDLPWPVRLGWRLYHLAWWPQRLLLNRADAVVTVSETTRTLMRARRLTRRSYHRSCRTPPTRPPAWCSAHPTGRTSSLCIMGSFTATVHSGVVETAVAGACIDCPRGTACIYSAAFAGPIVRAYRRRWRPTGRTRSRYDGVTEYDVRGPGSIGRDSVVRPPATEGFGIPLVGGIGPRAHLSSRSVSIRSSARSVARRLSAPVRGMDRGLRRHASRALEPGEWGAPAPVRRDRRGRTIRLGVARPRSCSSLLA